VITLQDLFEFRIDRVTPEHVVIGELTATGLRPTFLYKFEKHGITLPVDLFAKKPKPNLAEFEKAGAVS
jgi:pilus assembly protein CpaF